MGTFGDLLTSCARFIEGATHGQKPIVLVVASTGLFFGSENERSFVNEWAARNTGLPPLQTTSS